MGPHMDMCIVQQGASLTARGSGSWAVPAWLRSSGGGGGGAVLCTRVGFGGPQHTNYWAPRTRGTDTSKSTGRSG